MREHIGGFIDFLEMKRLENEGITGLDGETNHRTQSSNVMSSEVETSIGRLSYEEQKELNKQKKKAEKLVKELEARIETKEVDISAVEMQMTSPEGASDMKLIGRYTDLKKQLDSVVEEWEKAVEESEELGVRS